jgi:hypothetical protein
MELDQPQPGVNSARLTSSPRGVAPSLAHPHTSYPLALSGTLLPSRPQVRFALVCLVCPTLVILLGPAPPSDLSAAGSSASQPLHPRTYHPIRPSPDLQAELPPGRRLACEPSLLASALDRPGRATPKARTARLAQSSTRRSVTHRAAQAPLSSLPRPASPRLS